MQRKHRALVTGASRGIGQAIADALNRDSIEVITPTREELDLADTGSIVQFIERYANAGIDILVNNAGINILNAVETLPASDWQSMLQVNLTAPFRLVQGFVNGMKEKGWGRIVNISSVFSLV